MYYSLATKKSRLCYREGTVAEYPLEVTDHARHDWKHANITGKQSPYDISEET